MKKIIIILIVLIPAVVYGQQFPFMDGYNVNPFSLSPAFAGIHNANTIFLDYRSDWTGLEGGPKTYQLSYSNKFRNRVGLGGRFIWDKADIFRQLLLMGTYTYEVHIAKTHLINFGLSVGFYQNSIDLAKYYNDPNYVQDPALVIGQPSSKIKFATDISALYRYKQAEVGVLFSNIMFGTARYSTVDLTYKPLKNYLVHASYLFNIGKEWTVRPTLLFRGGQHIPFQIDIAPTVTWNNRFWITPLFKTGGIWGMGLGGEIIKGIILNYTYNMSSNIALNTFGSHQVSLGIRFSGYRKNPKVQEEK
jgi:type IX secretion system PorP/SprF family membrane protein